MAVMSLAARRSRVRLGLLSSLIAVVAVATVLLTGTVGYLSGSADAAARETLTSSPPTAAAVQVEARLADDAAAQADEIGQLLEESFAGTRVATHRSVHSNPVLATTPGGGTAHVILSADPELAKRATLVDGSWPADADAAAVQATAASELGVGVGDELFIEGRTIVVAATWLPVESSDPYWFGNSAVGSGFDGLALGPVVIAESALADLPVRSYARWTIVPDAAELGAADLPKLAAALDSLREGVDQLSGQSNVDLSGGLAGRVATVQRGLGVATGLITVPLVLVGAIGLIALAQLARLLATVRRSETGLLRARGASVSQLTLVGLAEAALVVVSGTVIGASVLTVLLGSGLLPNLDAASASQQSWPIAIAVAVIALTVCTAVGWHAAVVGAAAEGRDDSGRNTRAATLGATVLAIAAAGVSLWQFKFYGSPLVAGADGSIRVDPLTVGAPALTLVALAMVGLLAFGPVVSIAERFAARSPGILPVLPSRQVARRVSVFGVAVLLVTLSVSGTTLAAGYSATWETANSDSVALRNGTDVRVRLSPPAQVEGPGSLVTVAPYAAIDGVDAVAPVLTTPVRIGDDDVQLTAIGAEAITAVMSSVGGTVDVESLGRTLAAASTSGPTAGPVGTALPAGASDISLDVTVSAPADHSAGTIEGFAWLADADGALAKVSLGTVSLASGEVGALTAPLPEGVASWHLLGVEAALSGSDGARGVEVTFSGLGESLAVSLSSMDPTSRATVYPEPESVPVVVTELLAERLSLAEGATLSLRIPSTASSVPAVVAGVTPVVPGSSNRLAMIADLQRLHEYLLATSERVPQLSEVWITTDAPAEVARTAEELSRTSARVTTQADGSTEALLAPAVVALWWGMGGALLLAIIAILAVTTTFAEARRGEVIVLRALGFRGREQGRNRLIELAAVVTAAVLFGILTGIAASLLTVGELAGTAVASPVEPAVQFEIAGLLGMLAATLAALFAIGLGYAARVRRQAADTEYREEGR